MMLLVTVLFEIRSFRLPLKYNHCSYSSFFSMQIVRTTYTGGYLDKCTGILIIFFKENLKFIISITILALLPLSKVIQLTQSKCVEDLPNNLLSIVSGFLYSLYSKLLFTENQYFPIAFVSVQFVSLFVLLDRLVLPNW